MIVTASVLNVRSGPGLTFQTVDRLSKGDKVLVTEQVGDWSRVTDPCGWVHGAYLKAPEVAEASAPNGKAEIIERFGLPGSPQCSSGRVLLPAPLKLGWQNAEVTRVACHVEMEQVFAGVFAVLYADGLWPHLRTFDGIYNDRSTRGGRKASTHAWGISIDLNAATNRMGTAGDMPEEVVEVFEEAGFTWGGRWKGRSRDPMHFQFARGY